MSAFIETVMRDSVVLEEAGAKRMYWEGIPLGGRCQAKGPKCWFRHDWEIEEYPGRSRTYRDKVCKKCTRRIPLN